MLENEIPVWHQKFYAMKSVKEEREATISDLHSQVAQQKLDYEQSKLENTVILDAYNCF